MYAGWFVNFSGDDGWAVGTDWTIRTYYARCAAYTHCTDQGTGWRLPTAKELLTLVDTTLPQSEHLVIDTAIFAASQVDKNWWSSSVVSTAGSRSWAVNFESGGVQGQDAATPLYVRCVK